MCYLDFNPQRTAVIQFDFLHSENIINAEGYHVAENALQDDRDTFLHTHDFFEIFVMLVNYSGEPRSIEATLKTGYCIARVDYGDAETLAPYDVAVLYLEQFTRSWFAWANSMFGEMIYRLYEDGRLQSVLRKAQKI